MTTDKKINTDRKQIFTEYNNFIKQIDLIDIRVLTAKIDNLGCEELPSSNRINYTTESWYENKEKQSEFHAFQRYNVTIKDIDKKNRKKVAGLSVTFCVIYSSKILMSEDLFTIFAESNLPINTWPYFREFTHSSFSRMGWVKIVAPAYKIKRPSRS